MANLAELMRPKSLDEVFGNQHIVSSLKKQLKNNSLSQTIMFTGKFGSGKTSLAKILADELQAHVTDIDCGSEGNVDNIREIVESSSYSSLFSDKKVFILDEVHQLSKPAQSALLKTLEEEKPGVHFFLLTTEPQKILKTIKSRCVIYELEEASNKEIGEAVSKVEKEYGLSFEDRKDFWALIEKSEGSLRNVYSILEKIVYLRDENGFVSSENFKKAIGESSQDVDENLPKAILNHDYKEAISIINSLKKKSEVNPNSTMIGVYNYLKTVFLKRGNSALVEILSDISFGLSQGINDWYFLEHVVWKHVVK